MFKQHMLKLLNCIELLVPEGRALLPIIVHDSHSREEKAINQMIVNSSCI